MKELVNEGHLEMKQLVLLKMQLILKGRANGGHIEMKQILILKMQLMLNV